MVLYYFSNAFNLASIGVTDHVLWWKHEHKIFFPILKPSFRELQARRNKMLKPLDFPLSHLARLNEASKRGSAKTSQNVIFYKKHLARSASPTLA